MAGAPCRMLAVGETGPGSSWGVGAPGGRDRQRLQGLGRHHRAVCRRPPPRPPELHPSLRPGPLRARAGVLLGPEADRSGQERHGHRWGLWGRGVHLPRDVAAPALGPCVRTRDGRAPSSPSFRPGRSLKPGAVSLATVPDAPPRWRCAPRCTFNWTASAGRASPDPVEATGDERAPQGGRGRTDSRETRFEKRKCRVDRALPEATGAPRAPGP